jgi:hypothetical protein
VKIVNSQMSRNDAILVACYMKHNKKCYSVIYLDCADMDWVEYARSRVSESAFTHKRGVALCKAHDMDKKIGTEYGVRELQIIS